MALQTISRLFRMGSLLMLLVLIALVAAIVTIQFAIHGAEVKVPSFKGMTVADARSQAAGLGLLLDVDNRYYSADVAAGHILSQSPTPGTIVRREWRVRVAESLGAQTVDVPETVGSSERAATLALQRAGLNVGQVAHLPDNDVPDGTVLAQDPPGHAQGIEQPNVNLLVSAADDESPDGYVMPDLTDLPLASARAAMAKVGIKMAQPNFVEVSVGPIGTADAALKLPARPGAVLSQSPAPGTRVDQDTIVKLNVVK